MVASLASLVATVLLLAVLWPAAAPSMGADPNPFAVVAELWSTVTELMPPVMVVQLIALFILMVLAYLPTWLVAVSIGSEERFRRFGIGGPVLVFALLYVVMQLLFTIGIFAVPFGLGLTESGAIGVVRFDVLAEIAGGDASDAIMPLGFVPMVFLVAAWAIWRSARSWNRKVALV